MEKNNNSKKMEEMFDLGSRFAYEKYKNGKIITTKSKVDYGVIKQINTENGLDMYLVKDIDAKKYYILVRGSSDDVDWKQNFKNAQGKTPEQYKEAEKVYKEWEEQYGDSLVGVTGNSLGGGIVMHLAGTNNDSGVEFLAINPARVIFSENDYKNNDNLYTYINDADILATLQNAMKNGDISKSYLGHIINSETGVTGFDFESIETGHKGCNDEKTNKYYNRESLAQFLTYDSITGGFIDKNGRPYGSDGKTMVKIDVEDYHKLASNIRKEADDYQTICLSHIDQILKRLKNNKDGFNAKRIKVEEDLLKIISKEMFDKYGLQVTIGSLAFGGLGGFGAVIAIGNSKVDVLDAIAKDKYLLKTAFSFFKPKYPESFSRAASDIADALSKFSKELESKIKLTNKQYVKLPKSFKKQDKTNAFIEAITMICNNSQTIARDIQSDLINMSNILDETAKGLKSVDESLAKYDKSNSLEESISKMENSGRSMNKSKELLALEKLNGNNFVRSEIAIVEKNYEEHFIKSEREFNRIIDAMCNKIVGVFEYLYSDIKKEIDKLNNSVVMKKKNFELSSPDKNNPEYEQANSIYKNTMEKMKKEIEEAIKELENLKKGMDSLKGQNVDIKTTFKYLFKIRKNDFIDLLYAGSDIQYVTRQFQYVVSAQEQYVRLLKNTSLYVSQSSDGGFVGGVKTRLNQTHGKIDKFIIEIKQVI